MILPTINEEKGVGPTIDTINKEFFKEKVFETIVPRNVRLSEAPSHGDPINSYDPKSPGALAYEKLAKEIIKA